MLLEWNAPLIRCCHGKGGARRRTDVETLELCCPYGCSCVGPPPATSLPPTYDPVPKSRLVVVLLAVAIWPGHNHKVSTSVLGANGPHALNGSRVGL